MIDPGSAAQQIIPLLALTQVTPPPSEEGVLLRTPVEDGVAWAAAPQASVVISTGRAEALQSIAARNGTGEPIRRSGVISLLVGSMPARRSPSAAPAAAPAPRPKGAPARRPKGVDPDLEPQKTVL